MVIRYYCDHCGRELKAYEIFREEGTCKILWTGQFPGCSVSVVQVNLFVKIMSPDIQNAHLCDECFIELFFSDASKLFPVNGHEQQKTIQGNDH